jgi:hypothetical protein
MVKKLIILLFLFQIFEAYATCIYWPNVFYFTQTTIVRFENGNIGTIVTMGIPLGIYIEEITASSGIWEYR